MKYSSILPDLRICIDVSHGDKYFSFLRKYVVALGNDFPGALVIKITHRNKLSNINWLEWISNEMVLRKYVDDSGQLQRPTNWENIFVCKGDC